MDREEKFVLAKNAFANVARGGAGALVAIILPPFLTRLMSPDAYGAWSLVLELSAFIGYLDFGIQTAIGRFVAHAHERKDSEHRDRIVSTSMFLLSGSAVIGLAGLAALALVLPHVFRQLPHQFVTDVRVALVLVGGSLAVGLPCSAFNGIFIGLQRYEVPAAIIGGSRAFSAALLLLVVKYGGSIAQMAVAVAGVNLASYVLQYAMYRRMASRASFSLGCVSRETARELCNYCLSLSIWLVAMLLITGLDVSLVGYFDFRKVAYYASAATLVTFLAGMQNAVFHVMIPSTAVLQARGNSALLGETLITATRYGCLILLGVGLPLIFAGKAILTVWVGPRYGVEAVHILQVLAAANIIRLSALPYAVTLIGTGQQRLVTVTPLLEGASNLLTSVIAGHYFGAIGVAIGTLVGAIVGLAGHFVYNMPRTVEVRFQVVDYVRDGLLRPMMCALPAIIAGLNSCFSWFSILAVSHLVTGAGLLTTLFLVWRYGLVGAEKEKLWARRFAPEG